MNKNKNFYVIVGIFIIIAVTAIILFVLGRNLICECGYVKLWHGVVMSSENSQHIFDPYTFTHVLHGIGFFFLLWLVARRLPIGIRALIAVIFESIWEIGENTAWAIERYREKTISLDYFGDSIINSTSDIFIMIFGFWLASRLPIWVTLAIVVIIEVVLLILIRDNLFLNMFMIVHPIEAVRVWQLGI